MDNNKIDILCNTLNAQEGMSRLKYLNNMKDRREHDLEIIFRQSQIAIRELQAEIKCSKGDSNGHSRPDKI